MGQKSLSDKLSRAGASTEKGLNRYFFRRLGHFTKVRRFVLLWSGAILVLILGVLVQNNVLNNYYQSPRPVAGGVYNEGILGNFTNANPIYATSDTDQSISRLIFAGLFKFDKHNRLTGDLAKSWQVDQSGQVFTVKLKPHLTWQDGQPLTAADVVYTYHTIQDPSADSPLRTNWTDVRVSAPDPQTVQFRLPNPLSSFPTSLTNGIIPKHLLSRIPVGRLRSSTFNTQAPVGAGPFQLKSVTTTGNNPTHTQSRLTLSPFEDYWAGKPNLSVFVVQTYAEQADLLAAYRDNQLNGLSGLTDVPADIKADAGSYVHNYTLSAANMVFFNTNQGALKDKTVRQALVLAAKPDDIIQQLGYPAQRVDEPFLSDQFAYNAKYAQHTDDIAAATHKLAKAGWKKNADGWLMKKDKPLKIGLTAPRTSEARLVTAQLKSQWKDLGVQLEPQLLDDDAFHNALVNHYYSAVLYAETIGPDPDVFVYWDSTQSGVGSSQLNLSEYQSDKADAALAAGRTRYGDKLRRIKYEPFLQAWQADAPALGLYQPRYLYITHGPVYNLDPHPVNGAADRFNNVAKWSIRTARVTNPIK